MIEIPNKIAVRAFILDDKKRIFLGLRAKEGKAGYNQWALFGGKPGKGELLVKATEREVFEETGLRIEVTKKDLFTITLDHSGNPNDPWLVYFYRCNVLGGYNQTEINPEEHSDAKYFSRQELEAIDIAFNHRMVISKYYQDRVTG